MYQIERKEKMDGLQTILVSAEGALDESIYIIDLNVKRQQIDLELWENLQQDQIWQIRLYSVTASLDFSHRVHWMKIQDSILSLERLVNDVKQTYSRVHVRFLNLTDKQTSALSAIRNSLVQIKALVSSYIRDLDSMANILDENMTRVAQAATSLQSELEKLRAILLQ